MLTIIDVLFMVFSFVNIYFLVLFFILFALERKNIRNLPDILSLPFVSVIIPTYNKEKFITGTIDAVKSLNYPENLKEIIVVDDGSTDRTHDILKKISGINLYRKKNGGKADALNYGIEMAKGGIIACVDADSYPEKDSLVKAVRFFEDEKVAGVTVSVLVKNANKFIQKLQKMEYALLVLNRKLMEKLNCIYVTPGPLGLYRKDNVKKLGGFDTRNMTEDIEIAWKLLKGGYKIKMSVDSKVYTDVPDTLRDWWHQRIRWNVGGIQTALKYSSYFFKNPSNIGMFLLPLFTLSYVLALLGLAIFLYIAMTTAYDFIFIYMKSVAMGASMLDSQTLFMPGILTIIGSFTFLVSIFWLKFSLGALKGEISIRKNFLEFAVFLMFYMIVNPFNIVVSTWKLLRKSYKW